MTMPNEEVNSLNATRQFLFNLLQPKKTPRVPRYIRQTAHRLSKHFPTTLSISSRYKDVK
jgi:hypothetical protein